MLIPCAKCNTPVEFQIAQPRIFNLLHTSMVIIEHDGDTICSGCLQKVVPTLAGITGLQLATAVYEPPAQQSNLITMPCNSKTPS